MNKIDYTLTGGFPIELDDFEFEQTAIRNTFGSIGEALTNNTSDVVKMYGCVVTDGGATYDVTAGAVFFDGEFYIVDAHSCTKLAGAGDYYWRIFETFDPAGNEVFEDATTKDTYIIRKMAMSSSDVSATIGADYVTTAPLTDPVSFTDVFTLKSEHDTLRSDFTTIQLGSQRSGVLFYDQSTSSSPGSWTALTPSLIELSGSTFVTSGTENLVIPPNAWVKITISHVDTSGIDWLRFEGLSASGANNYVVGGTLSIDGSGNLDWIDTDPREFLIKNKTGSNQTLTIKLKLETKFSILIQTITNL